MSKFLGIKDGMLIFDDRKIVVCLNLSSISADREVPVLSLEVARSMPGAKVFVYLEDSKVGGIGVLFRGKVDKEWWKGRHGGNRITDN